MAAGEPPAVIDPHLKLTEVERLMYTYPQSRRLVEMDGRLVQTSIQYKSGVWEE